MALRLCFILSWMVFFFRFILYLNLVFFRFVGYFTYMPFLFWVCMEITTLCLIVLYWKHFNLSTLIYFLVSVLSLVCLLCFNVNFNLDPEHCRYYWIFCFFLFFKSSLFVYSSWLLSIYRGFKRAKNFNFFIFLFFLELLPFRGLYQYFFDFHFSTFIFAMLTLVGIMNKLLQNMLLTLMNLFPVFIIFALLFFWVGTWKYFLVFYVFCIHVILSGYFYTPRRVRPKVIPEWDYLYIFFAYYWAFLLYYFFFLLYLIKIFNDFFK